ncbi:MAG: insulinase family protein [Marinagarivorans sp.]|nr:insulinase family protein [Marinagarivorans sp.]
MKILGVIACCLSLVFVWNSENALAAQPVKVAAVAPLPNPAWPQPDLSPNDARAVEYWVLPNQLPVLLISDPKAEKAAAAMDVYVGSGDDPMERQGLAHFLEHMLFLGTKKYPNSEDYQAFIQQHGGSHNAYTSIDHTNYFFDISAEQLAGGLDRFAQFFIAPLFNEEYVERERNAVHSEFSAKFTSEYYRQEDVLRTLAPEGHPLSHFRTGNLRSNT